MENTLGYHTQIYMAVSTYELVECVHENTTLGPTDHES